MEKPIGAAFLSVLGTKLTDAEKRILEQFNTLGIVLFNRNLSSKAQAKELITEINEVIGREDVLIAVDEEGGRVNRLKEIGFPDYVWAKTLGNINSDDIAGMHCKLIAEDLSSLGINFNFAPCLDIEYSNTTPALKGRCLSSDKHIVARLGKTMWQSYVNEGICPCIKHLPGHGRAQDDPHLGLPIINYSLSELENDFYPFIENNSCPAAMTAHILIPEIDNKNPITFSQKGIAELIRKRIGFEGLLISDSIDMNALKGSILERAQQSIKAGCDVFCYCMGQTEQLEILCRNVMFLSDNALLRFEKVKNVLQIKKKSIQSEQVRKEYFETIKNFTAEEVNYDATETLHQMQKGEK